MLKVEDFSSGKAVSGGVPDLLLFMYPPAYGHGAYLDVKSYLVFNKIHIVRGAGGPCDRSRGRFHFQGVPVSVMISSHPHCTWEGGVDCETWNINWRGQERVRIP